MEWKASPESLVNETVSLCLRTCTATGAVLAFEYYSSVSLVLALVLAAFLCDTTVEACAQRLIVPFWHRVRGCRLAPVLNSPCLNPTSTHRLCTLPQNKRDSYATPNVRISRSRAPPRVPSTPRQ
jgi:hypothetical protein